MATKYLLNTFDYELFLGKKSGVPQECMIEPTENLLRVLEPFGVKAIFFVDTAYLYRLHQNATKYDTCNQDFNSIKNQLQDLIRKGHYVFPHIHSHWLDAKYFPEKNQWELSNIERYRFHNVALNDRELLFDVSIQLLKDIILPINPDYKINAYRAGGWSLQPFEDYKPFFEKHGITYDFTVMPGLFQFSNAQHFDFTRSPNKLIYRFERDVLEESTRGEFTEITSTVLRIPSYVNAINKMHLRLLHRIFHDHTYGRGEGQQSVIDRTIKPEGIHEHAMGANNLEVASVELLSIVKLPLYKKHILKNDFMQFVSHPKMLSNHNLNMFKNFLDYSYSTFELETDFVKIIEQLQTNNTPPIKVKETTASDIKISVIIPCYNVDKYIDECLQAVYAQELLPLEVICVDDGSTDRTIEILQKYKALYPDNFHLLINDGNRGATYSRNRGLSMAQGEYLNFFDADDLMLPYKLKHQTELLESLEEKPDILVSSCIKRYIDGKEKNYIYYKQDQWNALMDAVLGVTTSNLFKRTKVLEINGWSENLKSSQEYDLMFRMLMADANVYFDTKIVCINRERESGSISKTDPKERWKRYIDLRIRIYEFLKSSGKITPSIEQTFVNVLFTAIRIYYQYNKPEAIQLHNKYIRPLRMPSESNAISSKYLTLYRVLGFAKAQQIVELINPDQKAIH